MKRLCVAPLLSFAVLLLALAPEPARAQQRVPVQGTGEVSAGVSSAEKAAFIAQYDDDESDTGYTDPGRATTELAMLFDGVGGPDVTLGSVDVCLFQVGGDPKIRYEVVIWATDGPGGTPGTEIANFAAVATGVGGAATFDTTVLNTPLTQTDVYIGVRWNPVVDPDFAFCADLDGIGGAVQPGFYRPNESGAWTSISTAYGADYNAMMFRAFLSTPGVVADSLIFPAFTVDTTSGTGTTTLFAVRNLTDDPMTVDVSYYEPDGTLQRTDSVDLGARETETTNVRDVPGLATDGAGIARGYIEIFGPGDPDLVPLFAGDYLQVDVGDAFATGENARRFVELCSRESIRFFDFGSGSRLAVWIANPRGPSPGIDPVSFTVQVYDEAGNPVGAAQSVWADEHLLELEASDFTAIDFGTLVFDFSNAGRGTVFGEYSAAGLFSVGFDSTCENP